ncbi:MAG: hypothetical protein IKH04_10800 [Kiritimatiellae bacterium]|nr:hypothetical protein [Kiritimatiellia bacterium]
MSARVVIDILEDRNGRVDIVFHAEGQGTTGAEADAANAVLEFTALGVRLAAREPGAAPAAGTVRVSAGREVPV